MKRKMVKLLSMCVVFSALSMGVQPVYATESSISSVDVSIEESQVDALNAKEESNVEVKRNWLTEEIAKELKKEVSALKYDDFTKITKLDLRYENIDDVIPEELFYMTNLEYLDLNYCKLFGSIPEKLATLPKLKYLDLGDNKLQEIPDNLLKNIEDNKYEYIDVEGNKFDLKEGWYTLKGKQCYLDNYGRRLTGEQNVEGQDYIFDENGNVKTGFDKVNDKTIYYDGKNGILKEKWKEVKGKKYYFDKDGVMLTGWQEISGKKYYLGTDGAALTGVQAIEGKTYGFSNDGDLLHGFNTINGIKYYFDDTTGEPIKNTTKTIDGKSYKFDANGNGVIEVVNDPSAFVKPNGQTVHIDVNSSHSATNYNAFKYMTNTNNRISVHNRAIELHGGVTSNNCVYFTSEVLRRVGINLALSTCNTYDLEDKLQNLGFVSSSNLSSLKPGDIVFTNGYTHVYIFMCWDANGYAYIVDNQADRFDNKIIHLRQIYNDTALTDRATHFYYLPY